MNKKILLLITLVLILIISGVLYFQSNKIPKGTVDPDKLMEAIRHLESESPARIGTNPTDEEIFNSPHIKQIRIALNGYLDGTNEGFEEGALYVSSEEMKCGLNTFDKTYYQSKFVVLDASDNEWGGVQAYITFVDKPDNVFWVWVYGEVGSQIVRLFCEKPISSEDENDLIQEIIKDSVYTY